MPDHRRAQGRKHSIATVLAIYLLAALSNMRGPVAAGEYAQALSQAELKMLGGWWNRARQRRQGGSEGGLHFHRRAPLLLLRWLTVWSTTIPRCASSLTRSPSISASISLPHWPLNTPKGAGGRQDRNRDGEARVHPGVARPRRPEAPVLLPHHLHASGVDCGRASGSGEPSSTTTSKRPGGYVWPLHRRQRPRHLRRCRVIRHDHAHRQHRRERPGRRQRHLSPVVVPTGGLSQLNGS